MRPFNVKKNSFALIILLACFQISLLFAQIPSPADGKDTAKDASHADNSKTVSKKVSIKDARAATSAGALFEDWSMPSIKSGMNVDALPKDIDVLGEGQYPEFSRELVRLDWRSGDPIDLYILKPAGVKNPPVILYLYSYPSTVRRYLDADFSKFLTKNGFAAVGFVSSLTGERYHGRPFKQWFISELQESLGSSVHDVQLILNYLGTRGDLDMSQVGMFGDGSGASIAIMAAAVDPRIKALDLLNPWGDWPDWLAKSTLVPENERVDYLKPEFLKKVENLDPVKWLPELKTQQVRVQFVKGITVTPEMARKQIEAAVPDKATIVHYESATEFLKNLASSGTGFDWIKKQLGSTVASGSAAHNVANSEIPRGRKTAQE